MRRPKVMTALAGFACGAGTLALCLIVVNATEAALATTEVSLGLIDPGIIPSTLIVSQDGKHLAYEAHDE